MMSRRRLKIACLIVILPLLIFFAWKPSLLDDVGFSRAVFDSNGQLLRLTLAKDQSYRLYIPLKDISPQMREAVLLHEDQHFYVHPGFNPVSFMRAAYSYCCSARRIGGSTLTMQLARIKYRLNTRTIPGKLWQTLLAVRLEMHYSKDELFEAYLNLAPYGYNINGVGAAGFIYFHAHPQDLTLPQALTLAVLPQSPARREPENNKPSRPALNEARNRLFGRWIEEHPDDKNQKLFFALPLSVYGIKDLPFEAPHLTQFLLEKSHQGSITSSIDLDTQHLVESVLGNYVRDHHDLGIENASAMLVDNQTMQVKAMIGSANFKNIRIEGQVDGTRAKRSPGSELKPFIYALALDQGLIHPASILSDAPVSYGSYTPDNFERDFQGPVTARNALRLSRNIPAIKLAAQLQSPDLYDFLQKAKVTGLKDKKSYGLSMVLGGAEVSEQELAGLYAMLANDGVLKPLQFETTHVNTADKDISMLSPEASFLTLDMLSDTPHRYSAEKPINVYWKTGTSNGFHDAWTAGIFGHYTLVVWVGNFNNKSNPAFVGIRAAAPLFFAMTDAIEGEEPQEEMIAAKPAHLHISKVNVCATTGDLSLDNCPVVGSTWFIPGISPFARQDVYRKILVDAVTGKRACREGISTAWQTFEVWPSDLQQTMQKAGINKQPLPAYDTACGATLADDTGGEKPVILSPQPKIEYHARIDDTSEAVTFNASADGDVQKLSWFIDNTYLGSSAPGNSLFWQPQPGQHEVRVIDDHGRTTLTNMKVSLLQ